MKKRPVGRPRKHRDRVMSPAERARHYRQRQKPKVYHRHESDLWGTPQAEFDKLHAEFGFTLDACAMASNAKCERYFSPAENGLQQDWSGEIVFMNPPYSAVDLWIAKAYEASKSGATVVCIVNACVDTRWWHAYVEPYAEYRFPKGRWKFERPSGKGQSAPRPTAIVIFRPPTNVV